MKISVLCTNREHPVWDFLRQWRDEMQARGHTVTLAADRDETGEGDVLFLVSCAQIIREQERRRFRAVLVLHASDLPRGRGWSPHIWAVEDGANRITVCLLDAADPVDTGAIWLRQTFQLDGHELLPELNDKLFAAELGLMTQAVEQFDEIEPVAQQGAPGSLLRRRTPDDSRLDPSRTLAEQFDRLRVVDNDRYPAFFEFRGQRYRLRIDKDRT